MIFNFSELCLPSKNNVAIKIELTESMPIHDCWLLTGSNEGDRVAMLSFARDQLALHCGYMVQQSRIYETEAWGKSGLPAHLNQALWLQTRLEPFALLEAIQVIEIQAGRQRQEKWGIRSLDIDIIYFDNIVMETPTLTIPHAWLQQRRFALTPLSDVAPGYLHPVLKKTTVQLLEECSDPLKAYTFNPAAAND